MNRWTNIYVIEKNRHRNYLIRQIFGVNFAKNNMAELLVTISRIHESNVLPNTSIMFYDYLITVTYHKTDSFFQKEIQDTVTEEYRKMLSEPDYIDYL